MGDSGGTLSGTSEPSMRSCGGEPVVMCRSEQPLSIIARRSWCSVIFGASPDGCMISMVADQSREPHAKKSPDILLQLHLRPAAALHPLPAERFRHRPGS